MFNIGTIRQAMACAEETALKYPKTTWHVVCTGTGFAVVQESYFTEPVHFDSVYNTAAKMYRNKHISEILNIKGDDLVVKEEL